MRSRSASGNASNIWGEHFAVAPRRQRQAHRRSQQGDALLLAAPLQRPKGPLRCAP
jgi:hypothetical protein